MIQMEHGLWLLKENGERIALHTANTTNTAELSEYVENHVPNYKLTNENRDVRQLRSMIRCVFGTPGPDSTHDAQQFADSLRRNRIDRDVIVEAFEQEYEITVFQSEFHDQ